jgi:exonuclease SbcD
LRSVLRLLHTSDWHLGRLFHGVHLTDDQAWWCEEFLRLVAEARVDAVLLAGDVYDRAVPPPEAVMLLDEVLARLAVDLAVPTVVMAGNHDSPDRLAFGARLMSESGIHVFGRLAPTPQRVRLGDRHGDAIDVFVCPYAEPATARERMETPDLADHDAVMERAAELARAARSPGVPSVFMAHAFVAGGSECESERPLAVGGSASVSPQRLEGFDYVALGHLHRAQKVGTEAVRYSGSPLKYSFSEAGHAKSVSIVELDADGTVRVEAVELGARRDVRVLAGSLEEILAGPAAGQSREDYVSVELSDRGAILDAMARIREVWPNCLHLGRSAFLGEASGATRSADDHRRRDDVDLYGEFFAEVTGEAFEDNERAVLAATVAGLLRSEREG